MSFYNENGLYVLLLLVILIFISGKIKDYSSYFSDEMLKKIVVGEDRKKLNFALLIGSFIFLVLALARPVVENKPITIPTSDIDIVVAFDISKSMQCDDLYPNRLTFSKNKFNHLLSHLKDEKIGAIGFSARAFLIAPITNDYISLKYLVDNLTYEYISTKGSSILEALKSANLLLKNSQKKALIIFSDGGDNNNFEKEISYAKEHNIKVFVYAVATHKGGVIKTKDGVLKDKNGDIVVTRLNTKIKQLALQSDGAYLEYSASQDDIKKFLDVINTKFKKEKKEDIVINDNEELFYIPLTIALILFMISIIGFRRQK